MKVIKSLENRAILLKENTKKMTGQEGGFLNFLIPLMAADLPLVKNVLNSFAKSIINRNLCSRCSQSKSKINK